MADDPVGARGHDRATPFLCPVRGQVVTYLPSAPPEVPVLLRGTATGGVLTDPGTGTRWLPVIRRDLLLELVDIARVVVIEPARRPDEPPGAAEGDEK
jgi:hypothetical protein